MTVLLFPTPPELIEETSAHHDAEAPQESLAHHLRTLREAYRLRVVVVSDADGAILASAGPVWMAEALAAHAPAVARCAHPDDHRAQLDALRARLPELDADALDVRALFVDGRRVFLAALATEHSRERVLADELSPRSVQPVRRALSHITRRPR